MLKFLKGKRFSPFFIKMRHCQKMGNILKNLMEILLASGSLSRKTLLKQAGIPYETFTPSVEESTFLKQTKLPAEKICLTLARMKCEKAKKHYPQKVIIACDQLVFLKGESFGKAHTEQKAIENLMKLQGQTHELIHGLYMSYREQIFSHVCINKMSMRPLTLNQIQHYVLKDRPLKSAGSYLIDGLGLGLFEKIDTTDFSSIIGLPVTVVMNQLIRWGFSWLKENT